MHMLWFDWTSLTLQTPWTALFLFPTSPFIEAHVRCDLVTYVRYNTILFASRSFLLYDMIWCLTCIVPVYDINLGATTTTILSIRGVTIPIDLVSSATDSIKWHVVLFKPVMVPTSDPKSEVLCLSSLDCTEPTDPLNTLYAWDISHTFITMYHPYCQSPSALTEYLKQKLCQQRAKRLGRSLPAQVEPNIPLKRNTLVQWSCQLNGQNNWLWSGRCISIQLQVITNKFFSVTLTPTLIQQIVFHLNSQYLPLLSNQHHYSPVDRQAQHSEHTSLCHYGWVSHFPPIEHLWLNQPARQLAISEIWHAVLCLGPMNSRWSRGVAESPLTKGLFRHIEAIQVARSLICDKYSVRSSESALRVLKGLPFTIYNKVKYLCRIETVLAPFT